MGGRKKQAKKLKTNHDLDTFCGSACALNLILTGPARWAWHRFLTQQDSENRSIGTLTKEILISTMQYKKHMPSNHVAGHHFSS